MSQSPAQLAINAAREALSAAPMAPARAYSVENLLTPGGSYFLVVFGDGSKDIGVAAIADGTFELRSMAHLPGNTPHQIINAEAARDIVGADRKARADLVWLPGRATKSMLYPVWRIITNAGPRYVDQNKYIYETIEPKQERRG
jgi:hypothetical protein